MAVSRQGRQLLMLTALLVVGKPRLACLARSLPNRSDEETSVAGNAARLPGYFLIASDRKIVADDDAKSRYRAARGTSSASR